MIPDMTWTEDAACAGADTETFFPKRSALEAAVDAITICRGCPVIEPCFRHAMAHPWIDGVWGGTTIRQRRAALGIRTKSAATWGGGRS